MHTLSYLRGMSRATPVIIPLSNNPFKDDIQHMKDTMGIMEREYEVEGMETDQEVTIQIKKKYRRGGFVQIFHKKDKLMDLSPVACKIVIYIGMMLEFNAQKIRLAPNDLNMDRRTIKDPLLELISHNIIRKENHKPHMFWVNVTVILMGKI